MFKVTQLIHGRAGIQVASFSSKCTPKSPGDHTAEVHRAQVQAGDQWDLGGKPKPGTGKEEKCLEAKSSLKISSLSPGHLAMLEMLLLIRKINQSSSLK